MSATCDWIGGPAGTRTRVTVIRWDGEDLPEGCWEAVVAGSGEKVMVRPEDLRDAFSIRVEVSSSGRGGAA